MKYSFNLKKTEKYFQNLKNIFKKKQILRNTHKILKSFINFR